MENSTELLQNFKKGELRALSRLISMAENRDEGIPAILAQIIENTGKAKVIGITGPPGAGKSTLTNHFVKFIREEGKKVAVIAVDPVSPFSGGALLGDRIRLQEHFNDPNVYIRSLSTRGKLGGLSVAAREVVELTDAFGFDYVILETVGVGQSEVDIRKIADLTLLVLIPEWGDGIQTLKAGILEIADVFVVHKADREGAERVITELQNMLHMAGKDLPVFRSSQNESQSLRAVLAGVNEHYLKNAALISERRKAARLEIATEWLQAHVMDEANQWVKNKGTERENPYKLIVEFQKKYPPGQLIK